MLISFGRVRDSEPWRILEVAMNQPPDALALRLSRELKRLREPVQALIPFTPNASGTSEWIVPHVYVRGLNGSLAKLARTPGIAFTREETACAEWIAQLSALEKQKPPITDGSFVRLLVGPCAGMCGEVASVNCTKLSVSIQLPTKKVRVHAGFDDVQVVDAPPDKKYFFFS
jgi:transcription antitermination factor NusG